MNTQSTRPGMHDLADHVVSQLDAFAREHLDEKLLLNEFGSTKAIHDRIMSERDQYVDLHRYEGMLTFICRGAKFFISAPFVTQNSAFLREKVAIARQTTHVNTPLDVTIDVDPYVMDRIINFWDKASLSVEKDKRVSCLSAQITDDAQRNATSSLSTLATIMSIHNCAGVFHDESLAICSPDLMRRHLTGRHVTMPEFLHGVRLAWNIGTDESCHPDVRRLLLTIMVMHSANFCCGEHSNTIADLYHSSHTLCDQVFIGCKWHDKVHCARRIPSRGEGKAANARGEGKGWKSTEDAKSTTQVQQDPIGEPMQVMTGNLPKQPKQNKDDKKNADAMSKLLDKF